MVVKIFIIDNFYFNKKDILSLISEETKDEFEFILKLRNFQDGHYYFSLKEKEGQVIKINNENYQLIHIYANFLMNELTLKVQKEEKQK